MFLSVTRPDNDNCGGIWIENFLIDSNATAPKSKKLIIKFNDNNQLSISSEKTTIKAI